MQRLHIIQSKTQSPYTGLQGPTWFSEPLTFWPYPSPLVLSLTLLQLLWCLHCCVNIQTHSCIRAFPPVVPSARKAVPSNICMTSWRPLLNTQYRNGISLALISRQLYIHLFIVCLLESWSLPHCCLLQEGMAITCNVHCCVLNYWKTGTKFLINVLKWISEWIYTVIWKEKYFLIFL